MRLKESFFSACASSFTKCATARVVIGLERDKWASLISYHELHHQPRLGLGELFAGFSNASRCCFSLQSKKIFSG